MLNDAPRSVLVIQTAFIGDALLAVPLLKAVKDLWPQAGLDVLVRPPAENLLETLPYLREIIVYNKRGADQGLSGLLQLRRRLRDKYYDLALLPHRSFRSGSLAYGAKIPIRIGFNRGGGRYFHNVRIPYPTNGHEIVRNLQLLTPFGPVPRPDPPELVPTEEDIGFINGKLISRDPSERIALAPGSIWYTKRWPEDYFIELGRRFIQKGYQVALLGSGEDRDLCTRVAEPLEDSCINFAGQTTLRQSIEILRRCAALVTNDSAPTHLGVAAGTQVLTIFGSTSPQFGFYPFGPKGKSLEIELYCRPCTNHGRRSCPEKHLRCLKDITPDRVSAQVDEMLATMTSQ